MTTEVAAGSSVADAELEQLQRTVEAGLPAFLADLERLCSIDCGSYSPRGVNEVATWVAADLERMGARVERRPDPNGRFGDTVIGTFEGVPGAGPRLLLVGHMDTVFSDGTVAQRQFRIEDGIARAPGVSDMKAGLLAGLRAIDALRAAPDAWPFERVVFIANPDEEIGSPSSTPHIVEAAQATDACFVLECARANGDFVSARKGMADLRLTINGRAAHAGVEPEKGRSAIVAGAALVQGIHELNGRWPTVTANTGVFKAGTRPNIVCDQAELQVDIRALQRRGARSRDRGGPRAGGSPGRAGRHGGCRRHAQLAPDGEARAIRAPRRPGHRARGPARVRDEGLGDRRRLGREHDLGDGRAEHRWARADRWDGPLAGGVPRGRLDRAADHARRGAAPRGRARPRRSVVARRLTRSRGAGRP